MSRNDLAAYSMYDCNYVLVAARIWALNGFFSQSQEHTSHEILRFSVRNALQLT
jgi:hypothetical protein